MKDGRVGDRKLLIALFASLLVLVTSDSVKSGFQVFTKDNKNTVDRSALATCYTLGGKRIERVSHNNPEKGYKCKVTLQTLSTDKIQAKDVCESRIPYYIIGSEEGPSTSCTFQINVGCDTSYWQINRKCYKVSNSRLTWKEAQEYCKKNGFSGLQPKVAEYYSTALSNYLSDMQGISSAWVHVPELKDYFVNGEGNAAVYVQDGAFKYDTRKNSIMMDHLNATHQVLCEYTAPMTKAEMFYISEVYSEIYPINVYADGAIIPSADFSTIEQKELVNNIEQFTTTGFNERCLAIGRIINVESFPMTAIEVEFNAVKDYLTDERFYLTNAYKNDGKRRNDYRQLNEDGISYQIFQSDAAGNDKDYSKAHSFSFHKSDRFPTMAAMRAPILCALHSFNWKFGNCTAGPTWSEQPVRHVRKDGRAFCHYISNGKVATYDEARRYCEADGLGASLSGFDDEEEFSKIKNKVDPTYPLTSDIENDGGYLPMRYFDMGGKQQRIDNHYWLGGISPCETDCALPGDKRQVASWEEGVGINTHFLNTFSHEGHPWEDDGQRKYVSFRSDKVAFHVHPLNDPYTYMFFICGKTAPLERTEKREGTIKG
ncbi:hypothetical protein GCK72_002046 [Caenorhabditis remanei]|uniref:C-type lectin domain-containing protein n=1 Tax=Caenorhabditis remanei TaxID=31234 RepID=A0A6A5HQP8_CAERE|nr:hypothetical protein GCK72_002046 [Caenorhabditis remanei]KAF1770228.1 hypothetical protein GCK72_002046 [Caenorhabditis remanei]